MLFANIGQIDVEGGGSNRDIFYQNLLNYYTMDRVYYDEKKCV